MRVDHFRAGWPCELIDEAGVADYPRMMPGNQRFRVMHVRMPGCRAGDVCLVACGLQVTNDLTYPIESGLSLVLTPRPTGIEGLTFSPERGANVGQQVPGIGGEHHKAIERSAMVTIPDDGDFWIAAILVTGGGSNSSWGDVLKIDPFCASLDVARFRG